MSKAILIIDTPKSCMECRLKYLDTGDDAYFGTNIYRCIWDGSEILSTGIDEYCPLKPLPQKQNTEMSLNAMNDWLEHSERTGYNRCLYEILGEAE